MLEACLPNSASQAILSKYMQKKMASVSNFILPNVFVFTFDLRVKLRRHHMLSVSKRIFLQHMDHKIGTLKVGFFPVHIILVIIMMCNKGLTQRT